MHGQNDLPNGKEGMPDIGTPLSDTWCTLKRSRTRPVNLKVVMIIFKHSCQNSDRTNRRDDIESMVYI